MKVIFFRLTMILFLFATMGARAQEKQVYLDEQNKPTDKEHAKYLRIYTPEAGKYKLMEYYADTHKTYMLGGYSLSNERDSLDGFFTFFKDGYKSSEGPYDHNKKMGLWNHFYPESTQLWYTEQYKDGKITEINSFYEDGKQKRHETHGDEITGTCFAENGQAIPFTPFQVLPSPGFDLGDYLSNNVNYPRKARENNIQGRVIVQFQVNQDGSITNIKLLKRIGGGCDEEALRVIREMPKWKPGTQDDKPVSVLFTQPINFALQ